VDNLKTTTSPRSGTVVGIIVVFKQANEGHRQTLLTRIKSPIFRSRQTTHRANRTWNFEKALNGREEGKRKGRSALD